MSEPPDKVDPTSNHIHDPKSGSEFEKSYQGILQHPRFNRDTSTETSWRRKILQACGRWWLGPVSRLWIHKRGILSTRITATRPHRRGHKWKEMSCGPSEPIDYHRQRRATWETLFPSHPIRVFTSKWLFFPKSWCSRWIFIFYYVIIFIIWNFVKKLVFVTNFVVAVGFYFIYIYTYWQKLVPLAMEKLYTYNILYVYFLCLKIYFLIFSFFILSNQLHG